MCPKKAPYTTPYTVKIRPYTAYFKDITVRISAPGIRSGYGPYRSTWVFSLRLFLQVKQQSIKIPRSTVTSSVYGRKPPSTFTIRPYFAVIHVIVLRSYISVTVYGAIRSYIEGNGDCIRPPCTKTVNDRFFLRIRSFTTVLVRPVYN
jgi:hypothetical protein